MMNTPTQSQERAYIALLGLAEHFRKAHNIRKSVQCLEAVNCKIICLKTNQEKIFLNLIHFQLFTFSPLSKKVEARTHLQIGQMLFTYTNNVEQARNHLESSWNLSQQIQGFDDIKFDAACTLSQLYQQQNQSHTAKTILRKAIENSQHNIYWHSKLLFLISVSETKGSRHALDSNRLYSISASAYVRQRIQLGIRTSFYWS